MTRTTLKSLIAAFGIIVAVNGAVSASAEAAFGPKDLIVADGPAFGPKDIVTSDGPAFGPADVRGSDGPAFGPSDLTTGQSTKRWNEMNGGNQR